MAASCSLESNFIHFSFPGLVSLCNCSCHSEIERSVDAYLSIPQTEKKNSSLASQIIWATCCFFFASLPNLTFLLVFFFAWVVAGFEIGHPST
jgi:hypothetical protein